MSSPILPYSSTDILIKVRKVTGLTSSSDISDAEILRYINTFYVFDFPEHLRLESLKYNYQFVTSAGIGTYDFPKELYLSNNPPVYVGGYVVNYVQSRQAFFGLSNGPQFLSASIYTGNGTTGPYTGQSVPNTPLLRGFKPNPPGAYSPTAAKASVVSWAVLVTGTTASGETTSLVDDGLGNLISPNDPANPPSYPTVRGSINYTSGSLSINSTGFVSPIGLGNPINIQCTPVVLSRPYNCLMFQDQLSFWPIPDQGYTVSIECFKYPVPFNADPTLGEVVVDPQLREWWQLLAYGAADKIFADRGDLDNLQKYRPLLQEQLTLAQRRSLVQQSSMQTPTIYNQQTNQNGFYYGNYPYIF
jgi:hypothetical protein